METMQTMKILIAIDGSEHALAGVATVRDLPMPAGSRVTAMAVFTPRNASYYTEYEHYVQRVQKELESQPWQVNTQVVAGNPAEELVKAADELESDLIVLGAQHSPFLEFTTLGTTTERVIRHSPCSVLLVPGKDSR